MGKLCRAAIRSCPEPVAVPCCLFATEVDRGGQYQNQHHDRRMLAEYHPNWEYEAPSTTIYVTRFRAMPTEKDLISTNKSAGACCSQKETHITSRHGHAKAGYLEVAALFELLWLVNITPRC